MPSGIAAPAAPWIVRPTISTVMLSETAVMSDPTTIAPSATSTSQKLARPPLTCSVARAYLMAQSVLYAVMTTTDGPACIAAVPLESFP